MNSRNRDLDELLNIMEESQTILDKVNELNERIEFLRAHTVIKDIVNFKSYDDFFFQPTTTNIQNLISLQHQVRDLKSVPNSSFEDYQAGDILIAIKDVRLTKVNERSKIIDANGRMYDRIQEDDVVVILDINGSTYTMINLDKPHYGLIYANKTQLQVFFEHSGTKHSVGYHKVEFSVNGIDEEYFKMLDFIYLYEKTTRYDMKEFYTYKNQAESSKFYDYQLDEAFGTIITAYFPNEMKPNYTEIALYFNKFVVMFSQDSDKEIYRYNSKRSKFSKDSGRDGKHYFPKDVFNTKGTKGRVLNLLEIENIYEAESEQVSNV